MKIIVVKIGKSLAKGIAVKEATERAWRLNLNRAKDCQYVIGYASGIRGYFKLVDVFIDNEYENRKAFNLTECSEEEQRTIDKATEHIDFSFRSEKKYI